MKKLRDMTNKICFVKPVLTLTGIEQVVNSCQVVVSKLVVGARSGAEITVECEGVKCNSEHVLHLLTVSVQWQSYSSIYYCLLQLLGY